MNVVDTGHLADAKRCLFLFHCFSFFFFFFFWLETFVDQGETCERFGFCCGAAWVERS